jgi:hypothetical protein
MSPLDKFSILLLAIIAISLVTSWRHRYARHGLRRREIGRQEVQQLPAAPLGKEARLINQINRPRLRGRRFAPRR